MGETGRLLAWYDTHRRDLPWRRVRDPYRIWLSEVMLQQTRVDVVIPYYERFLERFPTVEDLGRAEPEEVLALWSGLGYYRRARQLHAAAGRIAREGMPETPEGWRELPGVGEYTAAAVTSIAFGEPVPVLDGNVERVLCRLHGIAEDPKRAAVRRRLLEAGRELIDPSRPGDSNQALMELGATVCTPSRPECGRCPLLDGCVAGTAGEPERYPVARKRRATERVHRVVVAVERSGRRLLFRRGDGEELLAGTWELPWVDRPGSVRGPEGEGGGGARGLEGQLAERYGGVWTLGEEVATVRHAITHRSFRVEVRRGEVEGPWAEGTESGWFADGDLAGAPSSSLVEKAWRALGRVG